MPSLEAEPGAIHTQMSYLARAVKDSVSSGDTRIAEEVLAFLDEVLRRPDAISEIENAVAISFLELSDIAVLGIGTVLPQTVRRVLEEQQQRWQRAT